MHFRNAVAIALLLATPPLATAEVHVGAVVLPEAVSWDFSEFKSVPLIGNPRLWGDFAFVTYQTGFETVFRMIAVEEARIAGRRGWDYDRLTEAPPPGDPVYGFYVDTVVGGTFVIRTREFHYVKIRLIRLHPEFEFAYTYQDDGTRSLNGEVPLSKSTWGGIKALYKVETKWSPK